MTAVWRNRTHLPFIHGRAGLGPGREARKRSGRRSRCTGDTARRRVLFRKAPFLIRILIMPRIARLGIFLKLGQATIAKSPLFALFVGRRAFEKGYGVGRGGIVGRVDTAWFGLSQEFALVHVTVRVEGSTWRCLRYRVGADVDRLSRLPSAKAAFRRNPTYMWDMRKTSRLRRRILFEQRPTRIPSTGRERSETLSRTS